MFISLQALMGFIPEFYMKQETSLQLLSKKYLKPHYYLKNYLTTGELQIFQPFIKMEINQNFAITVLSLWLVLSANSWEKKLQRLLTRSFLAITSSAIVKYGFLKGRSPVVQLLHIMEEWIECLEKGEQINAIYTDFEKHLIRSHIGFYYKNWNCIKSINVL